MAAILDVAAISDVTAIKGEDTFVRTIYAGNAVQTVKSLDSVKVLTVRGTAFPPTKEAGGKSTKEAGEYGSAIVLLPVDVHFPYKPAPEADTSNALSTWEGQELSKSDRPELNSARIVISGGEKGLDH